MESQRVDKWLWCARFYKTRGAAADAVKGGKVEINGARAKPAKTLHVGDVMMLSRPPYVYEIEVLELIERRVSAAAVQGLYRETDAGRRRRKELQELININDSAMDRRRGKLSKKERRARERMKRAF